MVGSQAEAKGQSQKWGTRGGEGLGAKKANLKKTPTRSGCQKENEKPTEGGKKVTPGRGGKLEK